MNFSAKIVMLKEFEILKSLTEAELNFLTNVAAYKTLQRGEHIFNENDPKKYVYLLDKGMVKLASKTEEDRVMIKNIIYDHNIFGENIFAGGTTHTEYAEVMSDVGYFMVPVEYINKLVIENSSFAKAILDVIVKRIQTLEHRIQRFMFQNAKSRIVDFIKRIGENRGIKIGIDECLINHGMSHKEIAYYTDTSRQTVARVLSELKSANLIHFSPRKPSKILIRNMIALAG